MGGCLGEVIRRDVVGCLWDCGTVGRCHVGGYPTGGCPCSWGLQLQLQLV